MATALYYSLTHVFVTSTVLGVIILSSIVGNVFVLLAIILERNLHNVTNYLIASLAVADLMVAALVMPLAAVNEVSTHWFLGPEACDAFTLFDVLCCTASILHLVSISLDRYWAVSRVDYVRNRTAKRILVMIGASWGISAVISIAPLFGWRTQEDTASDETTTAGASINETYANVTEDYADSGWSKRSAEAEAKQMNVCLITQDKGYTVFSTLGAFYIPLFFMLIVYARVYQLARARIRKKQFAKKAAASLLTPTDRGHHNQTTVTADSRFETVVRADLTAATRCDDSEMVTAAAIAVDDETADDRDGNLTAAITTTTLTVLLETPPESPSHQNMALESDVTSLVAVDNAKTSGRARGTTSTSTNGSHGQGQQLLGDHRATADGCRNDHGQVRPKSNIPLSVRKIDESTGGTPAPTKAVELTAREKRERARERKAARTLAIITGSFIGCWLPFFLVSLVRPFCDHCHFPDLLVSIITWLGYLSSLFNPIIYNVFNPDFRSASRKILFGKYRNEWRH